MREARAMEMLDVVDALGNPTGERVSRERAHRDGIRHRTSHVWIVRRRDGRTQVLLQKRSEDKDSFPGEWDISSAGHIPAGEDWRTSAVRELREELGVKALQDALIEAKVLTINRDDVFHGKLFRDRQITKIFLLNLDREASGFTVQKEELSEVRWFDLDWVLKETEAGRMGTCLNPEELLIVRAAAERIPEGKMA